MKFDGFLRNLTEFCGIWRIFTKSDGF